MSIPKKRIKKITTKISNFYASVLFFTKICNFDVQFAKTNYPIISSNDRVAVWDRIYVIPAPDCCQLWVKSRLDVPLQCRILMSFFNPINAEHVSVIMDLLSENFMTDGSGNQYACV